MKKTVLMCGPFSSRSGYGDHARSIFYAMNNSNKYDIHLLDVRWGDTPRNFLKPEKNKDHKAIDKRILNELALPNQPDIYIDIRIPNEFETFGKFNIGITAGIETNAVSQAWIESVNRVDLVIVPSEHSKSGFVNTIYDKFEQTPDNEQRKIGELKATSPIEVIFEGADDSTYRPLSVKEVDKKILNLINSTVKEKFAFLSVGQWVKGDFGEDRKDIGKTIKIFYETFSNLKNKPALILKTSGATFSIIDHSECVQKIEAVKNMFPSEWDLPSVYLLHGDLTDDEMNSLYNHPKIKTLISFTHGEGFGRPMLEATMVGLPVLCSKWSGPLDFLDPQFSILVDGSLEQVPGGAVWEDIIIPESRWFVINEHDAYNKLKYAFENPYELKEKAKRLMKKNRNTFTLDKMEKLILEVVSKETKNLPQEVSINLPKLKKN